AHLIRGAFYLVLLLAVCAIPFALAQSRSRGAPKQGSAKPITAANPDTNVPQMQQQASRQMPGATMRLPQLASAKAMLAQLPAVKQFPAAKRPLPHPNAKATRTNATIARLIGRVPLFTYSIDDGTAEDSIGLTAGGTFVACNSFPVTGGNNVIT